MITKEIRNERIAKRKEEYRAAQEKAARSMEQLEEFPAFHRELNKLNAKVKELGLGEITVNIHYPFTSEDFVTQLDYEDD